jgi:hypothetical protein
VLFFLAERFFEGIGVGLIDFIGNIFTDPGARLIQFEGRIFLRNLLDAYQDFNGSLLYESANTPPVRRSLMSKP